VVLSFYRKGKGEMFEAKWEVVVKCAKTFVPVTFVQKQFAKIHGCSEQK